MFDCVESGKKTHLYSLMEKKNIFASIMSRQLLAEPVLSPLKNGDQIDSRALRIRSACEWVRLSHRILLAHLKSMQIFKSSQFPSLMSEHGALKTAESVCC